MKFPINVVLIFLLASCILHAAGFDVHRGRENALDWTLTATDMGIIDNQLHQILRFLGPKGGIEGKYSFNEAFWFEGSAFLALLCQATHSKMNKESFVTPLDTSSRAQNRNRYMAPSLDISMELGWRSSFSEKNWVLELSLDYKAQYYWLQNWMGRDQESTSLSEGIQTHGVTGTIEVKF